jgi:hypothetical protein
MLTHCDSIGPSTSPFQKIPTPTPGFGAKLGAKLQVACREFASALSLKKCHKIRKFGKIKSQRPLPKPGRACRRDLVVPNLRRARRTSVLSTNTDLVTYS